MRRTCALGAIAVAAMCLQPGSVEGQPVPRRQGIVVRQIGIVAGASVRIKRDPASGKLYILQNDGIIRRVDLVAGGTATFTTVYQKADHGLNAPLGMAFAGDGTMFLAGNDSTGQLGTATIVKGVPSAPGSENRTWSVLAKTVVYRYGNVYNHRVNGIVVAPAGDSIYVNSGAATDHGELRQGARETGLTSIILRLPAHGQNIVLQDDREWLRTNGYLFAEGIRNTFDLSFNAAGDLFGVENSGDRDDPDELNWLQKGHHYGFPWKIGGNVTPQQFAPYDPHNDSLLSPAAWGGGQLYVTFSNDTTYPPPPAGLTFTDPIQSTGPDADRYRDTTKGTFGRIRDASSLGRTISTFTPHRSPDGIVFDNDSILAGDLKGGALVICLANGALVTALGDTSQDVLHVGLTKSAGGYVAHVTRLVSRINSPLGIELVGNTLYVLETGLNGGNGAPKLWEITLPSDATDLTDQQVLPETFALGQNYPNPFNPVTTIHFSVGTHGHTSLRIYDLLGREVATLVNEVMSPGKYSVPWKADALASGVYFYRLSTGAGFVQSRKMILAK